MTTPRWRRCGPALGLALVALVTTMKPAAAIPAFARREGVACASCHSVPPALNTAGRQYLRNGYRWSAEGAALRSWLKQFPGSVQVNSTAGATSSQISANLTTVQYYAAGAVKRDVAGWIDGTVRGAGLSEVGERNRFFLVFGRPARNGWRLRVGDFDPAFDNKPSSSLGMSAPAIYFLGSAANGYALGQVQRGAEAAYIGRDWSLGVFGGKGKKVGFTGNANGDPLGDWAGWVEYRPSDQPWQVTGYVYLGRLSTFVPTRIYEERMGQALLAGRYWGRGWEALLGAAYGHHRNAVGDGAGRTSRGLYLEGRWFPREQTALFGRLDATDRDTSGGDATSVTFGLSRQWKHLPVRATAETTVTKDGDSRVDALMQLFF
jgi:hypothetical protein